jgi:hypothetical protein
MVYNDVMFTLFYESISWMVNMEQKMYWGLGREVRGEKMTEFEGRLDSIVCDIMFESRRSNFTSEEGVKMIVDFLKKERYKSPEEVMDACGEAYQEGLDY